MGVWEEEKRAAAEEAAELVRDGMALGLGTGSTVAHFLSVLARRSSKVRCVATSPATQRRARELGLVVGPFQWRDRLDLAVDGADQVAPDLWLLKGGGGAHTRERVVAAATERFVVIVSPNKLVEMLGPPVPLEVLRFGLAATLRHLSELGPVRVREAPPTPTGQVLVDYLGPVEDPPALAARLQAVPGVLSHGLFGPELISEVLVGRAGGGADMLSGSRSYGPT
ncbi:MAG: ribose 5-phosphate isomerase A [Actinomycetota bacterium]|nr:ribose 5-phosphate isomerase A [Actinomycetota bacterium]